MFIIDMAIIDSLKVTEDKRVELKLLLSEEEYHQLKSHLTDLKVLPDAFDHQVKVGMRLNTYVLSIPKTKLKTLEKTYLKKISLKDRADIELYFDSVKNNIYLFARIGVETRPLTPEEVGEKR